MSILIKGMEMPKNCLHCCFASGCSYCEGYNDHCAFEPDDIETDWDFDHGVFPESIPDWCPLVPVPPHGRLIDADALTRRILEEHDKFEAMNQYDSGLRAGYRASTKAIGLAPTIIPAEEGE